MDLIGAFDSREFLESNDLTILMLVDLYGVLTLTKARRTSRRNEEKWIVGHSFGGRFRGSNNFLTTL